jgi:hypothetical protein
VNAKSGIVFVLLLTNVIHGAVRVDEVYQFIAPFRDAAQFEQSGLLRSLLSLPSMSGDTRRLLLPIRAIDPGAEVADYRKSMVFDRTLGQALAIEAPLDDGTMAPANVFDLLSKDGRVVVGRNANGSLFRWVEGSGAELLRDSQGAFLKATGTGISRDGSVVLASTLSGFQWSQGYAWRESDGVATPLKVTTNLSDGTLVDRPVSALGVSGDGRVIAVGPMGLEPPVFPSETQVQTGVWYLNTFNNILWNSDVNLSYDGSALSYYDRSSRLLSDGRWLTINGSILDISNDGDLAVGWAQPSGLAGVGLISSLWPYVARAEQNWSEDWVTLGFVPIPKDIVYAVSDNERSFLTVTETIVSQNSINAFEYQFTVVSIPEVPGSWMVGIGILGALIIARWRRAANRSR